MSTKLPTQYGVSPLTFDSPIPPEDLYLKRVEGTEELSRPFCVALSFVSEKHDLDIAAILDQTVTVGFQLANEQERYLSGVVTEFGHAGLDHELVLYKATIRPWFWKLHLASDCRIFQNMTVPDIIKAVFGELGFSDFREALVGAYQPREYCVQYMETTFNFVSRLMEDEGIFYFFEHELGKHTMVLADDISAFQDVLSHAEVSLHPGANPQSRYGTMPICDYNESVTSGTFTYKDYNFEKPTDPLLATLDAEAPGLERYEYPGEYIEQSPGDTRVKTRIEEIATPGAELRGPSYAPALVPGFKFSLANHPRQDLNRAYVVRSVTHHGTAEVYSNTFCAFPDDLSFRPKRVTPRARIFGTQTAVVVGKAGEEIWTDQYGRIKVQFHWDRLGEKDENSSCWIRVASGWAGKSWGHIFIPRIGQEVVISYLDGNPDRPLVTGSVYNAEQTVPYALPGEQTKSTIKSDSSKGSGGFNELRFEDKKGDEEVFFHAQKDMQVTVLNDRTKDVLNNETITVTMNRTATIEEGHETLDVMKGNRTITIHEGNESLTVGKGDRTVAVSTGKETYSVKATRDMTVEDNETHINKADFIRDVTGNYTLTVGGDITIEAGGNITLKAGGSLAVEAGMDIAQTAGTEISNDAGTNMTNKAAINMNNEAGVSLTSKASASQTVDGGGMLTAKAALVKIN